MATAAVTADGRARVLADGNEIPLLASGSGRSPTGPSARTRCAGRSSSATATSTPPRPTATRRASAGRCATAACPARRSSSPPSSIPTVRTRRPRPQRSLERLGVDQVDLYIIHWPGGGPTWAWPGMERARGRGFARSIGVSNFSAAELDQLLSDVDDATGHQPGPVQPVRVPPAPARGVRASAASRSRPTARWAPVAISATGASARSPSASGARRRRSCCAGACSATWSSCRSPPTASGSSRTLASSTSRCPPRTWPRSMPSTRPVAPTAPSSTTGGDDPSHAWRSRASCCHTTPRGRLVTSR